MARIVRQRRLEMEGVGGLLPLAGQLEVGYLKWQKAPDTLARALPTDMADVYAEMYD
jgi:hypothetical protein